METKFKKRRVNNYNIVSEVCRYYCITETQFFSKSRKRTIAMARQVAMYIMRYHGTVSTFIGIKDFFKFRHSVSNHATVIHSVNTIEMELRYNKDLKEQVDELCDLLYIHRKNYVDVHWFMNIDKGKKVHLRYGDYNNMGVLIDKDIIWEHDSIEKRNGRIYIKGKYNKSGDWIETDNFLYEEDRFICSGDGAKVFATGHEILV